MKILHVINGAHFGGASVMAVELAIEQRKFGVDSQVCLLEGGATTQRIRDLGVPVFDYDLLATFPSKRQRWEALSLGFNEICEGYKPDILHSHFALSNIMCARWKKKRNTKWIATLHGSWRQYMFAPETTNAAWRKPHLLLRYALGVTWTTRRADMIVTMSQSASKDWQKVGLSETRIRVIPNGISVSLADDQEFQTKAIFQHKMIVLGSLGYLAPVKGFDLLIAAFDKISSKHPNAQLVIAGGDVLGNTTERNKLHRMIHASSASQRITLLDEQIHGTKFLETLDGFVLASRSEGLSLALLEAMHLGLPCVVSSAGGNPEAIRNSIDGFVFNSGSIEDLADKLDLLLSDREIAKKMGASGRKRAREVYSMKNCAAEYVALYEKLLGS